MGVCGRVDRVRVQEILDYSSYAGDYKPMGLGQPMEYRAILEEPEVLQFGWGMTVPMMADAMGIRLEKVDLVWEKFHERHGWPASWIEERIVALLNQLEAKALVYGQCVC